MRRSLLFVPGDDTRKLARARDAGADTLLFDLEDSVAAEAKARARQQVAAAVRAGGFGDTETAVRVNPPGTPYFEDDLESVVAAGVQALMLPKSESAAEIGKVAGMLDALERRLGIADDGCVRLLALVETAAGIVHAAALGAATPRIDALCFGHADFALDMGLQDPDPQRGVIHHARCAVAIAARACRVAPIDTVCLAVGDEEAFRADAVLGLRLGCEGKLCIHPRQVEIANAVHTPTTEQVEHALRIVSAWKRAQAEGRGVLALDDRMVDAPVVAVQQRVLARARRAGMLDGS